MRPAAACHFDALGRAFRVAAWSLWAGSDLEAYPAGDSPRYRYAYRSYDFQIDGDGRRSHDCRRNASTAGKRPGESIERCALRYVGCFDGDEQETQIGSAGANAARA